MNKEINILCNKWEYVAFQKRNDKTEGVHLICIKRGILRSVKMCICPCA
jgi:hypothetical protein